MSQKKFILLKVLVNGIDSLESYKDKIYYQYKILTCFGFKKSKIISKGINNIKFVNGLDNIESGYFSLLQIKTNKFSDDYEMFEKLFECSNVKILTGGSIMWPYLNDKIIRVNFSVEDNVLVNAFYNIKKFID